MKSSQAQESKAHVAEAANQLLNEGKKMAHELYESQAQKVAHVQENIKGYSDEVMVKVKENPMTSVLVAAGVGFLLASLLRK